MFQKSKMVKYIYNSITLQSYIIMLSRNISFVKILWTNHFWRRRFEVTLKLKAMGLFFN
jgi:hypothetical protein